MATSDDPKLQAVRQFQVIKEKKGRRSILKDAKKYAIDMELQLEMGDGPMLSLLITLHKPIETPWLQHSKYSAYNLRPAK